MGCCIILGSQECLISLSYLCWFSCLLKILKAKKLCRMNDWIKAVRGWGAQAAAVIRFAEFMFSGWLVLSHFGSGDSVFEGFH